VSGIRENTNPDVWFPNYRRKPAISKEFGRLTRKSDLPFTWISTTWFCPKQLPPSGQGSLHACNPWPFALWTAPVFQYIQNMKGAHEWPA
jgi:hypothetical protein